MYILVLHFLLFFLLQVCWLAFSSDIDYFTASFAGHRWKKEDLEGFGWNTMRSPVLHYLHSNYLLFLFFLSFHFLSFLSFSSLDSFYRCTVQFIAYTRIQYICRNCMQSAKPRIEVMIGNWIPPLVPDTCADLQLGYKM